MLDIDFSFLKCSELDSADEDISLKYNELYKNRIINDIKEIDEQSDCEECEIDLSATTELDLRNIVEVNCKGNLGRHYCEIPDSTDNGIQLTKYQLVLIQLPEGTEIASVIEFGEIVAMKRRKFGLCGEELPKVLRIVTETDIEQLNKNNNDEHTAKDYFLKSIDKHNLEMKLVDVHYQFDRKKLYFYYTADGRVDFRELVKELAAEFKTRIELRQIGVRDEAKRVGGLGSCGREYCCSAFIINFKKITTQIANEQNLSTYLSKHSGPCGKLKCCLSFEVD
ncbi:MAG: regulatory iron-sulfur-containing complex subunit RicT [Bacteroidota bacterium]